MPTFTRFIVISNFIHFTRFSSHQTIIRFQCFTNIIPLSNSLIDHISNLVLIPTDNNKKKKELGYKP